MSVGYSLVCVDCGESLHFGKAHAIETEFHSSKSFGFSAIGNAHEDFREAQKRLLIALQHYFILHRQHELRMLPDNLSEVQDAWLWTEEVGNWEGELEHLLSVPIELPNPDREAEAVKASVLERIRSARENLNVNIWAWYKAK